VGSVEELPELGLIMLIAEYGYMRGSSTPTTLDPIAVYAKCDGCSDTLDQVTSLEAAERQAVRLGWQWADTLFDTVLLCPSCYDKTVANMPTMAKPEAFQDCLPIT
jgi:hypothetical protein